MPQQKVANKPKALRFITRTDYARTKGWWVRVSVEGRNKATRLFSDSQYGGKAAALRAAKAWRDQALARHKVHVRPDGGWTHKKDRRSRSGIVGVGLEVRRKGRTEEYAWQARWVEHGRYRRRSFTIKKLGYEGAFRRAVRLRSEKTGERISLKKPPPLRAMLGA